MNIHTSSSLVTPSERIELIGRKGATVWFTGLSGSGKSTITAHLERDLLVYDQMCVRLDGDNLRFGLCKDLSFSQADRKENIRRAGEVCLLMNQAGLIVLAGFISPYAEDREAIREKHKQANCEFIEVFLNTPLEICESRDPKGLYQKARSGTIPNFTGIDGPYEEPENPHYVFDTSKVPLEEIVQTLLRGLHV